MGISFKANVGVDMTDINFSNLLYGTPTKATSSDFVLKYQNGYRDEFEGHGFKYSNAGVPNGGRVESFAEYKGSKELFSIDGMNVVVTSIVKAAQSSSLQDDANLILRAMAGNDKILGSSGNDVLFGAGGNNTIDGRGGRDTIYSGPGSDTLTGGSGNDTFVFLSRSHKKDTVTDFRTGDELDLSNIGANEFIGSAKFSGERGEVRFQKSGGDTFVQIDFNGDKKSDFEIKLEGNHALKVEDFDF